MASSDISTGTSLLTQCWNPDAVNALMALKKGLTTGQAALSSWNGTGSDPCQWSYVTCGFDGRVSTLCARLSRIRRMPLHDHEHTAPACCTRQTDGCLHIRIVAASAHNFRHSQKLTVSMRRACS